MKRFLTWALALILALSLTAFAEGANGYYQKGDKIEDFAAALSDGTCLLYTSDAADEL